MFEKKNCCWTVSVVLMLKLNLSQMQYISESSKFSICWGWSGEEGGEEVLGDSPSPLQPQHILQKNDDKNEITFFCWFKKSLKFYSKCFFQPSVWKKIFCWWTVSVVLMLKLNLSQMQYISESSKFKICWGWSGEGGRVLGDSPHPHFVGSQNP